MIFSVGYGASVQGAVLSQKPHAPSMLVRNAIPLTIRTAHADYQNEKRPITCVPIIPRNTPYPTEIAIKGHIARNFQTTIVVRLYEGEYYEPEKNKPIGQMRLNGLNRSLKGEEVLDIFVQVDENGAVSAEVVDRKTKLRSTLPNLHTWR